MIKKALVFITITSFIVLPIIWVLLSRSEIQYVFVVTKSHYLKYETDQTIDMMYFVSDQSVDLINESTYGYLHNEDETFKVYVETFDVSYQHTENYLDTTYYGYNVSIRCPDIEGTYYIDELYIDLITNDKRMTYFLGELYVEYFENEQQFDFLSLEGFKAEQPKLSQIIIETSLYDQVTSVSIAGVAATFTTTENFLIIDVLNECFMLDTTYVHIEIDDTIYYVPTFKYFSNYELLSSGIYHKYPLNG